MPQEDPSYQDQLATAQAEIERLQQALAQRTEDLHRLIQWTQNLQQDITAVYHSITWQAGNFITQIALRILRRPAGPTARDHINKILANFEAWKINYFHQRRGQEMPKYVPWHETKEYALWIKHYDTLSDILQQSIQQQIATWSAPPVLTLLLPIPATVKETWLSQTMVSVQTQLYPHWELYLLPATHSLADRLTHYSQLEARIKVTPGVTQTTLGTALNTALSTAKGEWVALLEAHDQLAPLALYKIVAALKQSPNQIDLIYSDEDKLDDSGQRYDPYFKPDWNPDLFYSQNFLKYFTVYRRTIIDQVGGFQNDYPGYEDYDLALRIIAQMAAPRIYHIPSILYYHRSPPTHAPATDPAPQSVSVLQSHFQRQQSSVKVVTALGGHTRVIYPLPTVRPLVSLIIPTRDKLDLLRGTINGILIHTTYSPLEIIIIDNGSQAPATLEYFKQLQKDSRIAIIHQPALFNYSQLNNLGVAQAQGEIIGLLNNDLEMIQADWLTEMVSQALRPEVGAVGAKLYYGNDLIQHAGVIVGLGGMAGHGFKYLARESPGDHWRPFLIQNYSAVTGACLVMRRQVFIDIGGLEEKHLKVAFNDVDLCLRLREAGYRIVWTPYAELYHLESASRGTDNTLKKYLRLRHELNYMKKRWETVLTHDPCYNPNLTIEYEDFSLAWPPRI